MFLKSEKEKQRVKNSIIQKIGLLLHMYQNLDTEENIYWCSIESEI